ncbi:TauD/TfdA dioxygenase family protein [Noviherbaspirillum saxi]|uniref:TauD/TfdA family dioxygenase n=1 Tax=Noviherbaspirillum saxi TaxID=2320863 RepID=A0A3A3G7I0_9BURK|nr:TauD/TfdA family dioxygenase [Noviherbaspirillum saxi]RJF96140.1 TauD/TfdA family dioxygenase [Noviherbaspirillum saxi]
MHNIDIKSRLAVRRNDATLGAVIKGIDLSKSLHETEILDVLVALGRYGVLRFPAQRLTAAQLKAVAEKFGTVQMPERGSTHRADNVPEVSILSNTIQDGVNTGMANGRGIWHTDVSHREVRGFANLSYALKVPRRNGHALGATNFANMYKAYEDLSEEIKSRIEGATAVHSPEQYYLRRQGYKEVRASLSEVHRKTSQNISQPLVLVHPVSRRKVLYANPGFTTRINGWSEEESTAMLSFLFQHQTRQEYQYTHQWEENDLLIWDNLSTIHRTNTDYQPHEQQVMYRCRVLADRFYSERLLSTYSV